MATTTEDLWVLDTSVVVAWVAEDDQMHVLASEVMDDVRDHPDAYVVPHLFYSEVAHVLARKWKRDASRIGELIGNLARSGLPALGLDRQGLARLAELSCTALGGYDATFVALAERIGARWLTADTKAARIADEHAVTLRGWQRIKQRG